MLNVPNTITIVRVLLIPAFIILLMNHQYKLALVVFVTAGITDAVDGLVARIIHQRTRLGAYLDPIADKLLLTSAFVALAILKAIPSWLAVIVITRDVIISLGFATLVLIDRKPEIRPTTFSKINTVVQVLTISMVLFSRAGATDSGFVPVLILAAACTTTLTGLQYIYLGGRMTNERV